jgi:endonuclease YncB( thermonuclease family)
MKLTRIACLLAPLALFADLAFSAEFPTYRVRAEKIIDGDTGTFVIQEGPHRLNKLKVRLAGIDAPALPKKKKGKVPEQATEALQLFQEHADGRVLRLTVIDSDARTGMSIGVLDYWILDTKVVVNAELVRAGCADLYDPTLAGLPYDLRRSLDVALNEAEAGRKGLWSAGPRSRASAAEHKAVASD